MAKDFKVIIHDPERRKLFVDLFGTNVVCVRSFIPLPAQLPGIGEGMVYELDMQEINAEQRARLTAHIAGRFSLPLGEVERELEQFGCPILAEGTTLVIENPERWLAD